MQQENIYSHIIQLQIYCPTLNLLKMCVTEPPDRTTRQYFLKTFGEPEEQAWVPERSTHIFVGGYQFNNLPFVKGSGHQRDKNTRHSVIFKKILSVKWIL